MEDVRGQDAPVIAPHRFIGGVNPAQRGDEPLIAQLLQPQRLIVFGRAIGAGLFGLNDGNKPRRRPGPG